ncbi:MAG: hypothetical protein WA885_24070 [Phormidesmis sp.]
MKYFFLSDGWSTGRIWELGGLWNESDRRRSPYLQRRSLCIQEDGETLCLYEVEDAVLMVEVVPGLTTETDPKPTIGQVVLKRLLTAEQVIERLCEEDIVFDLPADAKSTLPPVARSAGDKRPVTPQNQPTVSNQVA